MLQLYRKRWGRRQPRKKWSNRKKVFILVSLFFFLFFFQFYIFVEKSLKPPLIHHAKIRIKQLATQAINQAISERIAKGTQFEKLIEWRLDDENKVTGFSLNYVEHMRIASESINTVQNVLNELTEIPEHIPLGQALNSPILASFGPKIPVRLVPAGAAKVDLNVREKNAGINMILIEVFIRIMAEVTIIIPFEAEPELVSTEIPISYLLVVGDVPMYYFDGKGNPVGENPPPPSISIPHFGERQETNEPSPEQSGD